MSANFEAKKLVVEEIKEKLSKAKSVAFVDYRGLTVSEDTALRKAFRENGAEYKVYKNRLMLQRHRKQKMIKLRNIRNLKKRNNFTIIK